VEILVLTSPGGQASERTRSGTDNGTVEGARRDGQGDRGVQGRARMSATQDATTSEALTPTRLGVTPPVQLMTVEPRRRAPRVRLRRLLVPKTIAAFADAAFLMLAMLAAYPLSGAGDQASNLSRADYALISLVSIPVWILVFARYGLYAARRVAGRLQEFRTIFHAVVVGVALLAVGAYAFDLNVSRGWVLTTFFVALLSVCFERELVRRGYAVLRRRGHFLRRVVVVGANDEGRAIAEMLRTVPSLGYDVVGFVDDVASSNGINVLGPMSETLEVCDTYAASGVIVATTSLDIDTSNRLVRELMDAGVHVELSSSLRDIASDRLLVRPLGEFPVVYLEPVRNYGWRAFAKRSFDILFAGGLLLVLSPVLLLIALAVKVTSRGPVFFSQQRIGRGGRIFTIHKFRTMVRDAEARLAELQALNEADGPLFKIRDDPRITTVGRFLRRASLDELPQLWNVVRGEMSMVGPRPALPAEAAQWEPKLLQRLRVRPGLTGMWQVHGRSNASFNDYGRLDLYYVDNWSIITDLGIIARTGPCLIRRDGAC
jgi:exopolysaccharide biosynthesis polyprenyl glycosylphosphotransferase